MHDDLTIQKEEHVHDSLTNHCIFMLMVNFKHHCPKVKIEGFDPDKFRKVKN